MRRSVKRVVLKLMYVDAAGASGHRWDHHTWVENPLCLGYSSTTMRVSFDSRITLRASLCSMVISSSLITCSLMTCCCFTFKVSLYVSTWDMQLGFMKGDVGTSDPRRFRGQHLVVCWIPGGVQPARRRGSTSTQMAGCIGG